MGFPLFRVTLDNDIEGPLVISEPGGWDDAKLKLERNQELHSLVEFYDQPLTFYGEDNQNNGGIDYVRNIEQTQGIDAQITILIEISNDDGDTYEVCVEDTLEIESVKETDFYKADFGVIRNGFWQNFMNRKGTPVNLLDPNDLDGQIRDVINAITIQLPSQKIQLKSEFRWFESVPYNASLGQFFILDWENVVLDEDEEKFNLPRVESTTLPADILAPIYAGDRAYDVKVYASQRINLGGGLFDWDHSSADLEVYIQKNDDAAIAFTKVDVTPGGGNSKYTTYSYVGTITLIPTDVIRIYAEDGSASGNYGIWGENLPNEDISTLFGGVNPDFVGNPGVQNYLKITADTIYADTDCEGFFIHEAGNAITDRIIGRDGTFYSEYLGNTQTQIQSYAEDGCGSRYAVTRGLNVRGYTLAEKPFFMSFDTWWNGINPLLNLGLGYETLGSPELEVLRIEPKRYFYNPITSIDFDFVNNIERSYSVEYVFKAIEIGFEKWSAESASGVDDPQTKKVYNTRFKTVGREIKILSKFIGASLAIEQTRRNRVEQGKDWRLDEDVMIIAMNLDGSPEFQPELDENFSSVTNLLNADTRYNIRLSVARNFERWKDFFNGCLQWYVNDSPEEEYRFASGEGNFDMTSTLEGSDCEGTSPEEVIDEKGNRPVTDDFLFMPIVYTFQHPMTWEQYRTIRDNRNNAIGVSRSDSNHIACFIMELEYEITHGKATFTVILGEHAYL